MLSDRIRIDRRDFIKTAAPFALAVSGFFGGQLVLARGAIGPEETARAVQRLRAMVNRERREHGLSELALDDLASRVAAEHARDMVDGLFLSHWGRDGRKPYQRYSFAGGNDAVQENAASYDDVMTTPEEVEERVAQLHQSMLDEVPPNDGHRRTILYPYHTHVGFGIAVTTDHIRMAELYISRYAEIGRTSRTAAPGSQINFSGRLLNPKHSVAGIFVYHEPLPQPPAFNWLRVARSYSLPESYASYWPRLYDNSVYEDGTKGTIEFRSTGFRTPIFLFRERGINTIVVWLERGKNEEPFPITQVCIRCE